MIIVLFGKSSLSINHIVKYCCKARNQRNFLLYDRESLLLSVHSETHIGGIEKLHNITNEHTSVNECL